MAQNLVESIFNSKNNLSNFYPSLSGVKNFDLERKHLFYGRIDPDGDAIYLDDSNLKQIYGGQKKTHFATDFVCDAFHDFRKNIKKVMDKKAISGSGLYRANLMVYKAWDYRDIGYSYSQYINKLYVDFVESYLEVDRKHEKIKDHKTFIKEFMRYILINVKYFPVTKTGFIASTHCSPFVSGLMIEIASEQHGLPTNAKIIQYVKDPSFVLFTKEARKFGFMIDKNAPWRLVFNLASGWPGTVSTDSKLPGAQRYMERFGVNYENVFDFYYRKAHLEEMLNIKNLFFSLYESFYLQYGTYEKLVYHKDSFVSDCQQVSIVNIRNNRQPPQDFGSEEYHEYWLKIILKLRFMETEFVHTAQNFNFFVDQMLDTKKVLGLPAALKYINDLTKGFYVPNFVRRGSFWNGFTKEEYQQKKKIALENAVNPSRVDRPVIGTKNIK